MRRFSGRTFAAALAIVAGYLGARAIGVKTPPAPAKAVDGGSAEEHVARAGGAAVDGNALVERVLETLERWPSVAARVRQSLRIGDNAMSGSGEYWQQGVGNQRRTCWQWQTMGDGQAAVFRQVFDKNAHLWTDCQFGERRSVTLVDVADVRRELNLAIGGAGQGGAGDTAAELELLGRGGLSQLVAELRRCFDFGAPRATSVEGKPALAIVGRWRPEQLARVWSSLDPNGGPAWPDHLPHHVVLRVGREDFFPYAIEYRRGADSDLVNEAAPAADALARYEFYDVQWARTMPERLFEFTPADLDWRDVTKQAIARLRAAASPAVAQRMGAWR